MRANLLADLLARALGLIRIFLTPFILLPAEYGQLGLASAMLIYVSFADLGLLRQFEVASSMRPETRRAELRSLFRKLVPRLSLSAAVLGLALGFEFSSWAMAGIAILTVFSFNLDVLGQMILRHQEHHRRLALVVFLQAALTTALLAPVALQWRVAGLLLLQALAPLVSFAISSSAWRSKRTDHEPAPWADAWGSSMALWLLLGQILMMIWITIDRLILAKVLSPEELGFWNLGSMMTGVLIGIANTWGTLRMRVWKNHPGGLFPAILWGLMLLIWAGGLVSLFGFTQWFAPKYQAGRNWNMAWFSVNMGIALLFVFDAYARARLREASTARRLFILKACALASGLLLAFASTLLGADARMAAILGLGFSVFAMFILARPLLRDLALSSDSPGGPV